MQQDIIYPASEIFQYIVHIEALMDTSIETTSCT